jgi:hypothetical protein
LHDEAREKSTSFVETPNYPRWCNALVAVARCKVFIVGGSGWL